MWDRERFKIYLGSTPLSVSVLADSLYISHWCGFEQNRKENSVEPQAYSMISMCFSVARGEITAPSLQKKQTIFTSILVLFSCTNIKSSKQAIVHMIIRDCILKQMNSSKKLKFCHYVFISLTELSYGFLRKEYNFRNMSNLFNIMKNNEEWE